MDHEDFHGRLAGDITQNMRASNLKMGISMEFFGRVKVDHDVALHGSNRSGK